MSKPGDIKVVYIPQVPMPAFEQDVPDLKTAALVLDTLSRFSLFEFEQNVKPDYFDMGEILRYETDGEGGHDWYSVDQYDIDEATQ